MLARTGRAKWLLTACVAVAAALTFWYVQPRFLPADKSAGRLHVPSERARAVARRYAAAVQSGDCDEVLTLTPWMRERLKNAQDDPEGLESPEAVRDELCARLQDRALEENRLRPEGVEDRYVFAPGADWEIVGIDRGRTDLTLPVEARVWLRVVYPTRDRALADEHGQPIRSLRVGINVSPEGYVVKAGVIGNLEVPPESIARDWGDDQGG